MKRNLPGMLILLTVIGSAGCSDSTKTGSSGNAGNSAALDSTQFAPPATAAPPVDTVSGDSAKVDSIPVSTHTATISTTVGDIELELYGKDAPKTVANFVGLAKKKFYDSLAFHRVALGYVIQTGDPFSKDTSMRERWGSGGESIYGEQFQDELNPASPSFRRGYVEGTLAMANSGPNTNLSQFFIVLSTPGAAHLKSQPNYTIFGFVRKGTDVLRKIEESGLQGTPPLKPVRIKTVTTKEAGPIAEAAPASR